MSKRAAGTSGAGPARKRTKQTHAFGGPSVDDKDQLTSQLTAPSSTGFSTRSLLTSDVPTLATLCARVFVANLEFLFKKRRDETQEALKRLPDMLIPRLFSMLSTKHPSLLSHPFISTASFFIRGDPMVLTGDLPGVSSLTVQSLSKLDHSLRQLQLTSLEKVSDAVVSKLFTGFPMLEVLVLRGSTKLGKATVEAVAKACKNLKTINLSYTSAPPDAIALLTAECLGLEVLKLAGVRNITDATFATILHYEADANQERIPLGYLRSLKLRHTLISETSLFRIVSRCRALSRLDVSFTPIRKLIFPSDHSPQLSFEKLSLTSTPLTSNFLRTIGASFALGIFSSLVTLQIGALGASPLSSVSTLTDSLTLTDELLQSLNDVLVDCGALESISLVGNSKLGMQTGEYSALANFVRKVGRRCKVLSLAGIPRLRSSALAGLLPMHVQDHDDEAEHVPIAYAPSPLHTLVLNGTDIGEYAAAYIASCPALSTLEIAGTKLGYDDLFQILDSCTLLTRLDLTSCRSIRVGDRRRFFEVWEDRKP